MPLYFPTGRTLLKSLNAVSSNIKNVETVALQAIFPPGAWRVGTMIRIDDLSMTKSGATDTGTIKVRAGPAGTSADTQLFTANALAAANRTWNGAAVMRLESATSVLPIGGNSGGFQQGTSNSALSAISLGAHDTSTTSTYVSVTLASSSTNDTVALVMGGIWLVDRIG